MIPTSPIPLEKSTVRGLRMSSLPILWLLVSIAAFAGSPSGTLSFEDRVRAQEAVERVYYGHRVWPKENPGPKPPFEVMMPRAVIEAKVDDYLKKSAALDQFWQRPLTGEQLQAEMDRMAKNTKDPAMLRELFAALGNDPFLIAECLARPIIAERLIHHWYAEDRRFPEDLLLQPPSFMDAVAWSEGDPILPFGAWWEEAERDLRAELPEVEESQKNYSLPSTDSSPTCTGWVASGMEFAGEREEHTAVWTGSEMIVWGGYNGSYRNDGGRYNPATDTWSQTSTGANCPSARRRHTAVWTGTEMIIWGGDAGGGAFNTGGRFNPSTNLWTPTSTASPCPLGRSTHTAVWTGTQMIIWGGQGVANFSTGGRYAPASDTWTATSVGEGCPSARFWHTAVWTGSEMIVWGGYGSSTAFNSGGRYAPSTDTWTATSTGTNCPQARIGHVAVWTGSRMVIWGGAIGTPSGGRYNPSDDTWETTSQGANCPSVRSGLTAVWTGTEILFWGGGTAGAVYGNGGRYDPVGDAWAAISTGANCPVPRMYHTAVWTGAEMIVWGGENNLTTTYLRSGARYTPGTDNWVPVYQGGDAPQSGYKMPGVWTGVEMIVWGMGSESAPGTGGRYNPATDSWTPTSTGANCPWGRSQHSAVWTGTEMIVWGGSSIMGYLSDGGRYAPSSDSWTPTSTGTNCPQGRLSHSAVWTGTQMIIWGGWNAVSLRTGGRYDPAGDAWTPTSTGTNCPTARNDHAAVWTGSVMVVWGGADRVGGRYDPVGDTWAATSTGANCPTQHRSPTAVWTGTEMIVWGGEYGTYPLSGGRYDPVADTWRSTSDGANCPIGRMWHSAVWTGREMIVWGGRDASYASLNSGGRYRPGADAWLPTSEGPYCPSARNSHVMVWTGDRMLVWGGGSATGGVYEPELDPMIQGAQDGCAGIPVELAAMEDWDAYQWLKDGADIPGATAKTYGAAESGSYTLRVTKGTCTDTSEALSVTIHSLPAPAVGGPVTGCTEPGIVLSTGSYSAYQWTKDGGDIPGATARNYTATAGGSYAVRVTDSYGCVGTSPAHAVTLTPSPGPAVTGDASGCASPGVVLSTGSFASYQWNLAGAPIAGAIGQTYTAAASGTYTVTVTAGTGCAGTSAGKAVTIHANPVPTITGPSAPVCQTAQLSTQAYPACQWYRNGSAIMGATGWSYSAPAPGSYTVRVTDSWSCVGTSASFVVNADPAPVITGPDSGCGMVQLITGSYSIYQWYLDSVAISGATGSYYWATKSGTYTVRVTNSAGCAATSAGKTVQVRRPAITGAHNNTCPSVSIPLSTAAAVTYQWFYNGNAIPGAAGAAYAASVSGTYTVQTLDGGGCWSTSDDHVVFVDYCPSASEVSPAGGIFPLRILKASASNTGYYLYYQRLDSVSGFNIYEGDLGSLYSHGSALGNDCGAGFVDLMTGEMRAELSPSSGNRYYLVTAFDSSTEGPSGFDSVGVEIPKGQSTCSP